MYLLLIIGIVVCVIGKLKLTPTITLEGVRARWYGLTLLLTAIPFDWLIKQLFYLLVRSQIFTERNQIGTVCFIAAMIYLVLLALPFRARKT